MKVWFFMSGVITFFTVIVTVGGDKQVPSTDGEIDSLPYWFYPDDNFLVVLGCIGLMYLYTRICKVGMEAYAEVSGKVVDNLPYILIVSYALYGLSFSLLPWNTEFVENLGDTTDSVLAFLILIVIFGLLQIVLVATYFLGYLTIYPAFIYCFLATIPYFIIGMQSWGAGETEVSKVAKKHAVTKRPSSDIERELAQAIRSGQSTDAEIRKIIFEMGPIRRFFHLFTYKKEVQRYREVYDLMKAQMDVRRERGNVAKTAHELEREKRRHE